MSLTLSPNTSSAPEPQTKREFAIRDVESTYSLPAQITLAASKQTYTTIRYLVDRDRVTDAYRAYAYFRWLDDWLDQRVSDRHERIAFVDYQQALIAGFYRGEPSNHLSAEEQMLAAVVQRDPDPGSGLHAYIQNMMAVMDFDARRRGRLVSERELTQYSRWLSVGVTDALHYFIGHGQAAPHSPTRYLAVTAAHITHLLRDTFDDVEAGYFNIPREFLEANRLDPCDLTADAYRIWVKSRVRIAKTYFAAGQRYMAQVSNLRCRIAGCAYIACFKETLSMIEKDGYQLRPRYAQGKSPAGILCRSLLAAVSRKP